MASATHEQAQSALLFLYTKVLDADLPWVVNIERKRMRRRLPVVLGPQEAAVLREAHWTRCPGLTVREASIGERQLPA